MVSPGTLKSSISARDPKGNYFRAACKLTKYIVICPSSCALNPVQISAFTLQSEFASRNPFQRNRVCFHPPGYTLPQNPLAFKRTFKQPVGKSAQAIQAVLCGKRRGTVHPASPTALDALRFGRGAFAEAEKRGLRLAVSRWWEREKAQGPLRRQTLPRS